MDSKIVAMHKREQAWTLLSQYEDDIWKLSDADSIPDEYMELVRKVMAVVAGEISFRKV